MESAPGVCLREVYDMRELPVSRVSRLRRSCARALLPLNLKKKRDCSQSSCLYCKLENALNKGLKSNFTAMTNKQQCQTRNEQRNREEQLPERRRQFSSPPWIAVQKSVTT